MNIKREWATPITAGAFLLVGFTGILMFFHLDSGLNKVAHEWLSWVLVAGVVLHIVTNIRAFNGHLRSRLGRYLMGGFALVLALTFIPAGGDGPPAIAKPAVALAEVPLSVFAQVAGVSADELLTKLSEQGYQSATETQSITDVVGGDFGKRLHVMADLLGPQH